MTLRPHVITLGVSDFQRALTFYRDGLGWLASSASQGDIAFFQMGGVVLALYPRDELAKDATISADGSGFSGVTLSYNTRSKGEVEETLALAERLGGKIVKPAQDVFWGGYHGYFTDPDGYLWEVAWNPFFLFDKAGNLALP